MSRYALSRLLCLLAVLGAAGCATTKSMLSGSIGGIVPGSATGDLASLSNELIREKPPITTSFADVSTAIVLPDNFKPGKVQPLVRQPRSVHGGFLLRPGYYEMTVQSYCLHAGTHGPSQGDGYLYAPLRGPRQAIIRHILQASAHHPEVNQIEIQMLIWSILARTKTHDLSPILYRAAGALLTPAELVELDGGAMRWIAPSLMSRISLQVPPEARRVLEAENELRKRLTQASLNYPAIRGIAVVPGRAPRSGAHVPSGRWSAHPGGYFVRYFPSSFLTTRVQVFVPSRGDRNRYGLTGAEEEAVEYDPTGDVAYPANATSQRLGMSGRGADGSSWFSSPAYAAPPPRNKGKQKSGGISFGSPRLRQDWENMKRLSEGAQAWAKYLEGKVAAGKLNVNVRFPDGTSAERTRSQEEGGAWTDASGRPNYTIVLDPAELQESYARNFGVPPSEIGALAHEMGHVYMDSVYPSATYSEHETEVIDVENEVRSSQNLPPRKR